MFWGKNSPDRFYWTSIICLHILCTFWMPGHDFEKEVVRVILNTEIVLPRIFRGLHNPIYLPTYLPTYGSDYLQVYLPIYLQVYVQTYLSVPSYLSIYSHTYLEVYLSTYRNIYLPTYRSTHLHAGLDTHLQVNLPTYPFTHPPTYISTHLLPTYLPNKAYGNIICCIALLYDWHLLPFRS